MTKVVYWVWVVIGPRLVEFSYWVLYFWSKPNSWGGWIICRGPHYRVQGPIRGSQNNIWGSFVALGDIIVNTNPTMGNKENIPYHSPIKRGEREGGGEGGLALSSFAALSFALYPFLSTFGPTLIRWCLASTTNKPYLFILISIDCHSFYCKLKWYIILKGALIYIVSRSISCYKFISTKSKKLPSSLLVNKRSKKHRSV
jgi:hypothetical protein